MNDDDLELTRLSSAMNGAGSAVSHPIARGTGVGRFVVLDVLNQTATTTAYQAYDPVLRREVVLEFLRLRGTSRDAARVGDAQAMAALSHRNIAPVYDVMRDGDDLVVAKALVHGQTLQAWLEHDERPWRQIVALFVQAGQGLAAAHAVGLLHRDFAPRHVLLTDDDRVFVTDFGAADASGENELRGRRWDDSTRLWAPERHRDRDAIDGRADQYAYCAALWEALCGAPPFADAALPAKLQGPPKWPRHVRVPKRIIAALRQGLMPEVEQRWPSMSSLLQTLADAKRRNRYAVGVLALPLLGTAALVWHVERADRCSGADAALRGVWDAERRASIGAALTGTGVAYAVQTWERVDPVLQRYADEWSSAYRNACEATAVSGLQSQAVMELRMSCLHRRKVELRSVTDVLRGADDQVVENAVQLVTALPSLSRCADVDALQAEVPPPDDPEAAEKVERARGLLSQARAQERAGHYGPAREEVTAAQAVLHGVDYAPAQAELALLLGTLWNREGRYGEAETSLMRALELSLAAGLTEVAATVTSHLGIVVGDRQARMTEGLRLAEVAVHLAGTQESEAAARRSHGAVLEAQGRYGDAERLFREALALREPLAGADHPSVAELRNDLGGALYAQGRYEAAEAEYRQALAVYIETLGLGHPLVAAVRSNLGIALQLQGHYAAAEEQYRDALTVREKALGAAHPEVASTRSNLGMALHLQGRLEEAETEYRNALAIRVEVLGAEHSRVADARNNLAALLNDVGRSAEAEAELRRVVALEEKIYGAEHPKLADSRANLGTALALQERFDEAVEQMRRALALREQTLGPSHPKVADLHNNLGLMLSEQGRTEDARVELEMALGIYRAALGPDHPRAAYALSNLGFALHDLGRYVEAEAELTAALAIYEKTLAPEHPDVAPILHVLARCELRTHRADRAREHLERAWKIDDSGVSPHVRAAIAFDLAKLLWRERAARGRAVELAERAAAAYAGDGSRGSLHEVEHWLLERRGAG